MKRIILYLMIIGAIPVLASVYRYPDYDITSLENTQKNVFRVNENFNSLFSKLNSFMDTYSEQSVEGKKIFKADKLVLTDTNGNTWYVRVSTAGVLSASSAE